MRTRVMVATKRHEEFRKELVDVARQYSDLPAIELLCIASQLVGQLVAMQNQFEYTPEVVMAHVAANIQSGNRQALEEINKEPMGRA